MEETVRTATPNPAARVRAAAITQVAVFEAVNSIIGDYEPYRHRIDAPPNPRAHVASSAASPEAAAVAAAHNVLTTLCPDRVPQLNSERDKSLAAIADGASKARGVAIGITAAEEIIAVRARDGFEVVVPYAPGSEPGEWQPTPPDFIPAFVPGLGEVATFAIRNGRQFRADPPPPLRSKRYARDYDEVKRVGEAQSAKRPEDRARVARFYEATEPDGIYYPAARQVSAARGKTLSENARLFALLAMAIWDSAVACFETKYHFNLWRPTTAIRAAGADGNPGTEPDPKWQSFVFTPPFPSYPSGHASFAAAARVILEHEFGPDGHSITLTNALLPDIVLHYESFKRIAEDIDDGRVYGGVHYRFDQEAGASLGKHVGEYVLRHTLQPTCARFGG